MIRTQKPAATHHCGGAAVRTESSIGEPFKDVKTDTHHVPHQNQDGNKLEQAAHAQHFFQGARP